MKRFLLVFAFFIGQIGFAQDFYLGAKTGLNLSSFTGEETDLYKQRVALHAGVTAELSFTDLFSIQTEVLYSNQGIKFENDVYPADYIGVPLLVKIYPSDFLSLDLGGQFSYLINDEYTPESGGDNQSLELSDSDFLFVAGLTYKTRVNLFLQARFLMGISEIHDDPDWKNQVFQFSVGYNFL